MAKAKDETSKAVAEAEIIAEAAPAEEAPSDDASNVAKAGKRSAKSLKEAEAKEAKEARKTDKAEVADADKPRVQHQPARSRLERRGKNYRSVAAQIDREKLYSFAEAVELIGQTNPVKFDPSVELHINLAVDPRQADQNIRGAVALPAGTGKTVRVAVVAEAADLDKATKAGADKVGEEKVFGDLDKNVIDFDVLIATPALMPKLGKYARVLGPKGLMPNPKSGTVTTDVTKAVSEAKAGRVEYRVDSTGIIHLSVGKLSFKPADLQANITAVMTAIRGAKPASLKGGVYIKAIHMTTTMGPSLRITTAE